MASLPHCHWRGLKEWQALGLEMSTPSDEACKMFDATLTQIVNYSEDPSLGGTQACMEKMFAADPDFLIGHILKLGTAEKLIPHDNMFAQEVYHLMELSQKPGVKLWERKHAEAVKCFAEGKQNKACEIWEDILMEKPTDILSLKFLHDNYIARGLSQGLRDSCGKALPYWKPDMPFYGNLLGMYAFGLEEMNMYGQAEKFANQALDINRHDAWASHCVAHIREMTGQFKDGIQFMSDTENNWNHTRLRCHNYWHWALYYVETGDFESAMGILDGQVLQSLQASKHMFPVTDAASMIFRLEAEGYDVGKRWDDCYEVARHHLDDFLYGYFDLNTMLVCLRTGHRQDCTQLVENIKQVIRDNTLDIAGPYREVTLPIMEAMQAYEDQEFDKAVEIMKPLKYHIHRSGGSHAQRDLFTLFTIHAAMRAKKSENQNYASHMLMERKQQKGESPLADRLLQKLLVTH